MTTFGTVQKWSLRPLLNSPKGGLFLEDTECRKHTERMTETFLNMLFKGELVLILGGLNRGILLYLPFANIFSSRLQIIDIKFNQFKIMPKKMWFYFSLFSF